MHRLLVSVRFSCCLVLNRFDERVHNTNYLSEVTLVSCSLSSFVFQNLYELMGVSTS